MSTAVNVVSTPRSALSPKHPNIMNPNQPPASPSKQLASASANPPPSPRSGSENQPTLSSSSKTDEDLLLELAGGNMKGSLQGGFEKFRKERSQLKKVQRAALSQAASVSRTPEWKANLRSAFVSAAKKYQGVPYHPSYHRDVSSPYHGAPLFLDCCGLTRRVVQDLASSFGFVIGPGNQAYQFETLPVVLTEEELKPGDIIFTEGVFFDERKKPQKHNIVHVEIFLGGGESGFQTIGARKQTGVIEILPHYKFESKGYEIKRYHLRSLETWLDGACKPLVDPQHWEKKFGAGKCSGDADDGRSVFECADDEGEGGEEELHAFDNDENNNNINDDGDANNEEVTADEEGGGGRGRRATSQGMSTTGSSSGLPSAEGSAGAAAGKGSNNSSSNNNNKLNLKRSKSAVGEVAAVPPAEKSFYVNKSNGWNLVSAALEKRGYTRLPFNYTFRTNFSLKWVEGRSKINFLQHKTGQMVNHIPNNDVITNKLGLLEAIQDYYTAGGANFPPAYLPMTYRLDRPSDALFLMQAAADESQGTKYWIHKPAGKNCGKGIELVRSKDMKELVTKGFIGASENEFTPKLTKMTTSEFIAEAGEAAVGGPASPERRASLNAASLNVDGVFQSKNSTLTLQKGLVQSYITNPYLLDGKKFDVRVYCLIARTAPSPIVLYHPGYARLSLEAFTLDDSRLGDRFVHLTNAAVQKHHPLYKEQDSIWSMDSIGEYIATRGDGGFTNKADVIKSLDEKFCAVITDVWKAARSKLAMKFGYFDLLGFDFMLDDKLNVKLLEVNTNPALHLDCKVHEDLIPKLIDDTLGLVVAAHERRGEGDVVGIGEIKSGAELREHMGDNFVLLVDEVAGFEYLGAGASVRASGTPFKAIKALQGEAK